MSLNKVITCRYRPFGQQVSVTLPGIPISLPKLELLPDQFRASMDGSHVSQMCSARFYFKSSQFSTQLARFIEIYKHVVLKSSEQGCKVGVPLSRQTTTFYKTFQRNTLSFKKK